MIPKTRPLCFPMLEIQLENHTKPAKNLLDFRYMQSGGENIWGKKRPLGQRYKTQKMGK